MMRRIESERGQLQISFGMIFSIIIIIAIVATSFYVIRYFLNLNKCNEVAFFFNDFQKKVDSAWASGDTQSTFEANLPASIKAVCFGNYSLVAPTGSTGDMQKYNEMKNYIRSERDKNLFIYPLSGSCDSSLAYYNLKHTIPASGQFFCVDTISGKISVKLSKTSSDSLVKLSKV
jgi:hypothetical protein